MPKSSWDFDLVRGDLQLRVCICSQADVGARVAPHALCQFVLVGAARVCVRHSIFMRVVFAAMSMCSASGRVHHVCCLHVPAPLDEHSRQHALALAVVARRVSLERPRPRREAAASPKSEKPKETPKKSDGKKAAEKAKKDKDAPITRDTACWSGVVLA